MRVIHPFYNHNPSITQAEVLEVGSQSLQSAEEEAEEEDDGYNDSVGFMLLASYLIAIFQRLLHADNKSKARRTSATLSLDFLVFLQTTHIHTGSKNEVAFDF